MWQLRRIATWMPPNVASVALGCFLAKFVLCMRRKCYFRAFGQHSDIAIRFSYDDFLKGDSGSVSTNFMALYKCCYYYYCYYYLAVRGRFQVSFYCTDRKPTSFLFLVYLTYWSWAYVTHNVATALIRFSPSLKSVNLSAPDSRFYCWYVKLRCDLDLGPFDLELS